MTLSLFRRGFIQIHAGRQTRDMDRWHWSGGTDQLGYFDWCFHVPGFTFWFDWRFRA